MNRAFTVVELLIVIVVIAILASISIVAYNGVQTRARESQISSDLKTISKAIVMARDSESKTLEQIVGTSYSAGQCVNNGIDSSECKSRYSLTMSRLQAASGVNVASIYDPWGRPYFIDENEREPGVQCSTDTIAAFSYPFAGNQKYSDTEMRIVMSGYTGC